MCDMRFKAVLGTAVKMFIEMCIRDRFSEDAPMCHQIAYIISHIENELRKEKVAEKSKDYITATNRCV